MKFIEKIHIEEEERVEVSITKETFCLLIAFHKLGLQSKRDDFADIIDFTVDGLVNHAIEELHKRHPKWVAMHDTALDWFESQRLKQDKTYELYEELKKASKEKLEVTNENT